MNPLDLPDDFFRIRLVCTILDFCGGYFDRGSAKRKLDFFLTFFQVGFEKIDGMHEHMLKLGQYYIATKEPMPMDIDFIVQDSFALTRPQWKLVTGFEEAGQAFANLVKQNYKAQEANKGQAVVQAGAEAEAEAEASSSDDDDVENTRVPALDEDAQSSSEEAEPEVGR